MPHDEIVIAKLLRSRGLRVTKQRLLILDAICQGGGHVTAAEIIALVTREDASIDQSTVHRTLHLMAQLGVVAASSAGMATTVYEIVGETPHHHLLCTVCGKQIDIPHARMRAVFDRLERRYGFAVSTRHLMLDGVCASCLDRGGDD